jgi:nicotinate-nucleotide adenylyltransferase
LPEKACRFDSGPGHQTRVSGARISDRFRRHRAGLSVVCPGRELGLAGLGGGGNGAKTVKIGFLGGSFDPVHFGHLMAAQDAYEQCGLDRLFLVPAAQAPLKPSDMQSSAEDRLAMLRAAVEWDQRFEISDYELKKGGVSYTVDSARYFRACFPDDELYWIIGGDQLPKLHLWKDIVELAKLVEFIFLERPGYPVKPREDISGLRLRRCDGHLLAISSTELRERERRRLSLDYFVPHKAIVYIRQKGLYLGPR